MIESVTFIKVRRITLYMDHVAIMRKSWDLTEKIISGEKSIESRWYDSRVAPWDRIKAGDTVYFKNSGEPIRIKSSVGKVLQFSDLNENKVADLLKEYAAQDGIDDADVPKFFQMFKDKKYCILIFLRDVRAVEPFDIDKSGFGSMSAWIVTEDVEKIKN